MAVSQRIFVFVAVLTVGQMSAQLANGQNDKIRTAAVDSLAFSPDGKLIATAFYRKNRGNRQDVVHITNVETAESVGELKGHRFALWAVAWSPDGTMLASVGEDRLVRLWDARTYKEVAALAGHEFTLCSVAFSPDGKTVAAGGGGTARLWSVRDKLLRATIRTIDTVGNIAFAPDGKTVATSGRQTVQFWSVDSGNEIGALPRQASPVSATAFSPTGGSMATVSLDRTLKVWELPNRRERFAIDTGVPHYCVAYSPDGKLIAAQAAEHAIQLHSTTNGKVEATLQGHTDYLRALAFSPNGAILASGGSDSLLILWDVAAHLKNPIGDKTPKPTKDVGAPLDGIIP